MSATTFNVGYWNQNIEGGANTNGQTYVAYLFAHNAGGFGASGTDNAISCGSFTTDGSGNATVTLSYEPQFVITKRSDSTGDWSMLDTMRGWTVTNPDRELYPNYTDAEGNANRGTPTATGFTNTLAANATYIYIAIRRGPMRTPTSGTSVFSPVTTAGDVSSITAGFPVDLALGKEVKNGTSYGNYAIDRMRGGGSLLQTNTTGAEVSSQTFKFDSNTQFLQTAGGLFYGPSIYWLMRRAPGFFDVVCYTGTGVARTVNHNLGVAPELIITKCRSTSGRNWLVTPQVGLYLWLNSTMEVQYATYWNTLTSTSINSPTDSPEVNGSGLTYVNYLFATCPGVSKVGAYAATASTLQVDCGFTSGARFVLIKRIDDIGAWYVWDSARGIVPGNDPYLLLNSTAAEVTSTDWVDTLATGFEVSNAGSNLVNVGGGVYIFLAIA
jgi:hypothetical protein